MGRVLLFWLLGLSLTWVLPVQAQQQEGARIDDFLSNDDVPENEAAVPPAVLPGQDGVAPVEQSKTVAGLVWQGGSAMFNDKERALIYQVNDYITLSEGVIQDNALVGNLLFPTQKEAEVGGVLPPLEWPGFFLNSQIYYSDDNWVFWLNGQRYRKGQVISETLEVLNVEEGKVDFLWRPGPNLLEAMKERDLFAPFEFVENATTKEGYLWNLVSPDGQIFAASDKAVLRFRLRPNQTMVSQSLSIEEGEVKGLIENRDTGQMSAENPDMINQVLDQVDAVQSFQNQVQR